MAAITTDPSVSDPAGTSGVVLAPNAPAGPPPKTSAAGIGPAATTGNGAPGTARPLAADLSLGSASAKALLASASAIRSCGLLGPARLGSTVPRSSSSVSE